MKQFISSFLKKIKLYYYFEYLRGKRKPAVLKRSNGQKVVFFLMTPTYGNLGDQAIEIATDIFIKKYFPNYLVVKKHLQDTIFSIASIKKSIRKDDIVVLQGGGNFGNLYMECEIARRYVISHFKHNCIISMPCTITYTNNRAGKKEMNKTQKVCNMHPKLFLLSRENHSYQKALSLFPKCHNFLVPDIVMLLKSEQSVVDDILCTRNFINVCLRTDNESLIRDQRDQIIKGISLKYNNLIITDTQLYRSINDSIKIEEVKSILRQFCCSRVVITDRLHGLIFSYLTETPCLVLASLDDKIVGTYEWIKENPNITFLPNGGSEEVVSQVEQLLSGRYQKSNTDLDVLQIYDKTMKKIGELNER